MTIDFSIFNGVDFTNPDNLWFSLLISIVAIIVFLIFILIVARIIKIIKWIIKKIFIKTFNTEVKRPESMRKSGSMLHMQNMRNIGGVSNVPEVKPKEGKAPELHASQEKVGSVAEKISVPRHSLYSNSSAKKVEANNTDSSIIFKGAQEVSRTELEQEMKSDAKVWQAASGEGLAISPLERAKLIKDVLPSNLGASISKDDLKIGVRRLGEKMSGAKTPEEHAKIRKEIKFFKKIGGIK
ncbi:MAG: hypothetical protein NTY04_01785 [Candidatus Staskawiczbacteria bacterium]|nr:hypothetical protein [Candidatus Staskawiczbacteria bacterium]